MTALRAWQDGRIGRLLLDRPAALNAVDIDMSRALERALAAWRDQPEIHALVVEGHGRAFCAGGDIRAARLSVLNQDWDTLRAHFQEEYALNRIIATYPKPYVALVDGVCMGAGVGLAVHGRACVASEAAVFAMPETAIGLFPDVGTSYLLPRLPGALGMYLALTGARLHGADAVHAGLATHYVPRADLAGLNTALARDGVGVLGSWAHPLPPFSLAPHRAVIDHCFSAETVAEIFARLAETGDEWAKETLAVLNAASPSSLLWTFALHRQGAHRNLEQSLAAELTLSQKVVRHPDFIEGVRAMVVDKDRTPHWQPSRLEDVDQARIAALFD